MRIFASSAIFFLWPAAAILANAPATAPAVADNTPAEALADTSFIDALQVDRLFSDNRYFAWLWLLAAILVALALGRVVLFLLQRVAKRLEARGWHAHAQVFSGMVSPVNLAVFALGLSIGLGGLRMSPLLQDITKRALLLLYTTSILWYAFNLVTVVEVALRRITSKTQTTLDDALVPVIRKALRLFILVIGALFILQNVFDRDIGAWLAGLGIAGLAVSLAAQDSLKNLFGSLTILFDRPFAPGQRIRYGAHDGTVEEIGFRSTKVRTLEGSVVTIPNSAIVNEAVNNLAVRKAIRRVFNVTIPYNTPVANVRRAVEIIRDILASEEFRSPVHDPDPAVNADPPRVFFDEFNVDSLNIKVYYWFRPVDWWAYLEYTQRFNLRLMEEFAAAGIELAFPTQTLYLAGDRAQPLQAEFLVPPRP